MVHFHNLVSKKGLCLVFQRPNRIFLCSYNEVIWADFDWNMMTLGSSMLFRGADWYIYKYFINKEGNVRY